MNNTCSWNDNQLLRGLAIIAIILHNFCHRLPQAIIENEYTWDIERVFQYNAYIANGGPHLILNLFSHNGHYGVTLFLFLSGFGLALKYDTKKELPIFPFLWKHAKKMWKLLIPAVILYYGLCFLFREEAKPLRDAFILVTFTANLFRTHPLVLGPWWWFSLMMQLYLLYRLVFYRGNKTISVIVITFCIILQYALTIWDRNMLGDDSTLMCHLHYNFPPAILPFALGLFVARNNPKWIVSNILFAVSVLIVIAGSYSVWIWNIASPFCICIFLKIEMWIKKSNLISWTIRKIGYLSSWIFVLHPIVRKFTLPLIEYHSTYCVIILYLIITIFASWIIAKSINFIQNEQASRHHT